MLRNDFKDLLVEVKEDLEDYLNKRIDLVKLHLVEELAHAISGLALKAGILFLFFFGFLFVSLAFAFFIGELLNSAALGFLIIAAFYFLIALIFYLFRKKLIEKPVIQALIKLFFLKYNENEK